MSPKHYLETAPPTLSKGLDDRPPPPHPLISRYGSDTDYIKHLRTTKLNFEKTVRLTSFQKHNGDPFQIYQQYTFSVFPLLYTGTLSFLLLSFFFFTSFFPFFWCVYVFCVAVQVWCVVPDP